jgi:2-methylcitrate dehydratase PrpD
MAKPAALTRPSASVASERGAASAARRLVRYARELRVEDLPEAVVEKVEVCLLDMLACSLTAGDLPWSRQAVSWVRSLRAAPDATVIGTNVKTAPPKAAFVNAIQANGLIREDMHTASASHIGVVVLPTALAVAEARHASGRELITAVVAGYQAMGRVGRVVIDSDNARVFRPTGLLGPIGGALTAACLLALDEEAAVNALGLAGNLAAGLNEWAHSGGTDLFFQSGFAARNAVASASLAALGARASETILDGQAGMIAAFGGAERAGLLAQDLRDDFEILTVYHKPAPACNYVQTPSQAALELVTQNPIQPGRIDSVEVLTFPAAVAYPGCDFPGPFTSMIQAKMSIQFSVASVLVRGELGEDNFRQFDDPETGRIAARVRLSIDPEFTAAGPVQQGAEIRVRLVDGAILRSRLRDLWPFGPAEVRARFRAAATNTLGDRKGSEIEETLKTLRRLDDVAGLMRLLSR